MDLSGLSLIKVTSKTVFKQFDCGDEDLNDFLLTKAKPYTDQLLATTYIIENDERILAFFSIFNDSLRAEDAEFESKNAFKKLIANLVPHGKRHLKYFPALKIGRLAVCRDNHKIKLGTLIVDYITDLAINSNGLCACKFITVDAYAASLGFYEKKGFSYLFPGDEGDDTRQMHYDLTPLYNRLQQNLSEK
jgi:hypothetical protein